MKTLERPDGVEVVGTRDEAERMPVPPLLVVDALTAYLDDRGLGRGAIAWSRIGDGHSNVTYAIHRGDEVFVLRRGPRPPIPRSTHDMQREARIQSALREAGIPVPQILAVCDDEAVLGVPFYVMRYVDGLVVTDETPAVAGSEAGRLALSEAAVDQLVALHRVGVESGPLASLGRPNGYLTRQVERFGALWEQNTSRSLPEVQEIGAWLAATVPTSQQASVVHGDYRLGNLMFAPDAPVRVAAILDWEMATLGDPLADLGYFTATYAEPGSVPTPLELTSVTREPGYLTREGIIRRYSEGIGLDLSALPWYQTLALWKAAIFCEEIYSRWLRGEKPEDAEFAPSLERGVPVLLEGALEFRRRA